MRIYSKFRDYYDSARSYGIDPNLVYERETKEYSNSPLLYCKLPRFHTVLPRELTEYSSTQDYRTGGPHYIGNTSYHRGILGFCGKAYTLFYLGAGRAYYTRDDLAIIQSSSDHHFGALRRYRQRRFEENLEELKAFLGYVPNIPHDLYLELKAPVFYLCGDSVIANPKLSDYEFYKMMHPVQAFQELSMFLGNVLVEHDKVSPIPDKYLIEEKGFDKHSFRHPTRLKDLKS